MKTLFAISFFIFVTIIFGETKHKVEPEYIDNTSVIDSLNTPCFESVMDSLSDIHKYNEDLKRKLNKLKKQKKSNENL